MASSLLDDESWVSRVQQSLRGVIFSSVAMSGAMKVKADLLHKHLKGRLTRHIAERIPNKRKHDHYTLNWVKDNLSRISGILSIIGHVREDLAAAQWDDSLFHEYNPSFVRVIGDSQDLEGCYVFYDVMNGCFVRSGTVVRSSDRTIAKQYAEHKKNAKDDTTGNNFYSLYPSKDRQNDQDKTRRGYFEDLVIHCGLCFSRDDSMGVDMLCSPDTDLGIFSWNQVTIDSIMTTNFPQPTLRERQLIMLGYLFEMAYDLLIAPSHNVSHSAGFECPLSVF
jgi:hypothetical protein